MQALAPTAPLVNAGAHFMATALELSRQALPRCRPNPPVGSLIVHCGEIIARGFTGAPGEPHAEAAALRELQCRAAEQRHFARAEVELYVTLEPCSFAGRTPSCARALVDAGIRRVIVATLDPHPKNRGRGIEIMRAAGIDVDVGLLEADVLGFIAPYLIRELD
jgi:pyrimidine deaminase RibD-like protein